MLRMIVTIKKIANIIEHLGFPGGLAVKNPPASAGDTGLIPGSGRSPGEGNGYPLRYSCLGQRSLPGHSPGGQKRVGHILVTKQEQP